MNPATLSLVLSAAFIHASWNILLKRVQGGLSFLWFVDILQSFVFAPWVFGVTVLNPISYILILVAMTVAPVSQIAPTREVSTLVGALVGGRLFAEQNLRRRLAAASVIVIGVIAVARG